MHSGRGVAVNSAPSDICETRLKARSAVKAGLVPAQLTQSTRQATRADLRVQAQHAEGRPLELAEVDLPAAHRRMSRCHAFPASKPSEGRRTGRSSVLGLFHFHSCHKTYSNTNMFLSLAVASDTKLRGGSARLQSAPAPRARRPCSAALAPPPRALRRRVVLPLRTCSAID